MATSFSCIHLICVLLFVVNIVNGAKQRFSDSTLQKGLLGCHFAKFCTVTIDPPQENDSNITCCSPCSCLPNCWLIGDCCPDVEEYDYKSPFGNIELQCEGNYINFRQINIGSGAYYKMITQCPTGYTDNKIKQLCEEPFGGDFSIHNFSFSDVLPVSNAEQFIFRNVHCAACHGIHNTHRWDMLFASFLGAVVKPYFELKDVVANFGMYTVPSEGLGAERSKCFGNAEVVSTCNQRGHSQDVDEDLEQACRFSGFPLEHKTFISITIYSNIFCLLCNVPSITIPLNCGKEGDRDSLTPYTTFFTFDTTRVPIEKTSSVYRCPSDQVHDAIMDICRDLICPFNKKPEYEACVESGFVWFNAGVIFPLSVSVTGVNIETIQNNQHLTTIENSLMSAIGLSSICNNCGRDDFYTGSDEHNLILDMSIYLTPSCKYGYIEASMAPIKSKAIHLEVVLDEMLSINATITMFPEFNKSVNTKLKLGSACGFANTFKMNRLFDCPYVVLNETEYCFWMKGDLNHRNKPCRLSVNDTHLQQTMEMVYANGETNIRICLSSYLPRFSTSIGCSMFQPCLNMCLICATLLGFFNIK